MPEWVNEVVPVLQVLLNAGALIGGAIIWKLYVDKLKAASEVKDATIQSVEKSRDHWREKAEELEKRRPEVVEKSLAERIQIRDAQITRFRADHEFDKIALRTLEMDKAQLEQDLFGPRGSGRCSPCKTGTRTTTSRATRSSHSWSDRRRSSRLDTSARWRWTAGNS